LGWFSVQVPATCEGAALDKKVLFRPERADFATIVGVCPLRGALVQVLKAAVLQWQLFWRLSWQLS
jgi:hypothetical protein